MYGISQATNLVLTIFWNSAKCKVETCKFWTVENVGTIFNLHFQTPERASKLSKTLMFPNKIPYNQSDLQTISRQYIGIFPPGQLSRIWQGKYWDRNVRCILLSWKYFCDSKFKLRNFPHNILYEIRETVNGKDMK